LLLGLLNLLLSLLLHILLGILKLLFNLFDLLLHLNIDWDIGLDIISFAPGHQFVHHHLFQHGIIVSLFNNWGRHVNWGLNSAHDGI
jgi:hypothetical protein